MLVIKGKHSGKSDRELLERYAGRGDLDLLGELFSRYMHLVYGVSLKYLGNREDAQDAVMQIFETLVRELPSHDVHNFKSWLYVLTKNHCLMRLRSEKSARKRFEEIKSGLEFMESEEEMHPLDREDNSPEKALKECIDRLKREQKQCIELFYYGKKCYSEIADSLRLEEKQVKSYLQNGKRNLRICLEEKNIRQSGL
jgi:RNA polymerase sigma-70 factor, ECF subfamily